MDHTIYASLFELHQKLKTLQAELDVEIKSLQGASAVVDEKKERLLMLQLEVNHALDAMQPLMLLLDASDDAFS